MKEKNFKTIWIVYFLQLIPSVICFLISFFLGYDEIVRFGLNGKHSIKFIDSAYNLVAKTELFSGDFFGMSIPHDVGYAIRWSICLILCFIAIVVIAVLAKNILNKKEKAFLFLPYILSAVLMLVCFITDIVGIIWLTYSLCVLTVNIYLPIKLKKLQKS